MPRRRRRATRRAPFARNVGVTVTDVMIGCTAMLEAVNSLVFELGLWQSWTSVGKRKRADGRQRDRRLNP